ncbi:PadR family transcriptional regulator [Paenibacillus thiaminolyticus]|uniref:PadR family transcriptional regulator n=1 Tax=Paenibacillus thiaminolyticus TaxID=49283 RepID=UPI00232E0A21|nr:PadR family transcriptional regulator [Paenibacillus thiaminolyticus]WCF07307.1 PadR family transcriptional regulator [Paenibacillus thiaminolyticus]
MLEYIILGLLMEGPMSGYDMKKTIDSSVGLFYRASYGSLYPALKRLADKGLLSVSKAEGGRNKKEYTLLPAGKEQFVSWLAEPLPVSRNEVLLRIFFYDYLDEDIRQARLTEYENKLESEMRRLQAVQEIVGGGNSSISNTRRTTITACPCSPVDCIISGWRSSGCKSLSSGGK